MGKSIFRFTTLVFQGLVTAGVIGVFVLTVVFANGTGTDMSFVWGKMLLLCIHAFATFAATLLIAHYTKTATGAEVQVVPLLFLALTLKDIDMINLSFCVTHLFAPWLQSVAFLFQVAFILSSFLFMECGIFQTEINSRKMSQFVLIALASSLYLGLTVPVTYESGAYQQSAFITSSMLRLFLFGFGFVAICAMMLNLLQESPSRKTITKTIAFVMLIVAHTLQANILNSGGRFICLGLHVAGLVILGLVARSSRIWG